MRKETLITEAKGRFAETIVSTVLEVAGYQVVRLGVEELVSEVKAVFARGGQPLQLPTQLRTAPDFLVIDPETGSSTLLEVKFRRQLDDAVAEQLHARLAHQLKHWPGMVTAIVCADRPEKSGYGPSDIRAHIGCLRAKDLDRLVESHRTLTRFQRLRSLGGIFPAVADAELYRESEQLVAPIRAWA